MQAQIIAVLCVIGLALGQILFKVSANLSAQPEGFFSFKAILVFLAAICLYGVVSIAWVWILQRMELGRAYPLMALAFVLVPLGSNLIFGERFQPQYFVGVALIVAGIVVATKS